MGKQGRSVLRSKCYGLGWAGRLVWILQVAGNAVWGTLWKLPPTCTYVFAGCCPGYESKLQTRQFLPVSMET